MERKELSGIEEYPGGLSSIPDNFLQPMRLCGFKANSSRFQVKVFEIEILVLSRKSSVEFASITSQLKSTDSGNSTVDCKDQLIQIG
jgi:hypothetical protein